ncbi:hypothetical protein N658DRAFT_498339 [Parathielavia hyrcaniae]|uniref:Golgi apparatus membrane protein TVP18 n=1 Tax=Parathielavia hyrcaniae TaxID=113614 RepID=A0AAN6SZD5_9PEZI|nr:hypothetical protein N658DRAFT_498339 [Parathielavia hyrcaniae]
MILCFALGIANVFTGSIVIIVLSAICLYVVSPPLTLPVSQTSKTPEKLTHPNRASSFVILFIEVPLLLRICPTSPKFDTFIRKITTNYMRAAAYAVMGLIQWLTIISRTTSLIVAAVFLTATAACYLLAGIKGQAFVGSKTLGGAGVAQMIV